MTCLFPVEAHPPFSLPIEDSTRPYVPYFVARLTLIYLIIDSGDSLWLRVKFELDVLAYRLNMKTTLCPAKALIDS